MGRIALSKPGAPGVILLRVQPLNPSYIAERILAALEMVKDPYGKLIVVRGRTVRIIALH